MEAAMFQDGYLLQNFFGFKKEYKKRFVENDSIEAIIKQDALAKEIILNGGVPFDENLPRINSGCQSQKEASKCGILTAINQS